MNEYYMWETVFPPPGLGSSPAISDSERSTTTRGRSRGKGRRGRGRGDRDWGSRSYDDEPEERSKGLKPAYWFIRVQRQHSMFVGTNNWIK